MEERIQAHERQASRILSALAVGIVIAAIFALIAALSPSDEIAKNETVQQILAEFPEAKDLPSET